LSWRVFLIARVIRFAQKVNSVQIGGIQAQKTKK
jgi:hypothetical protein